MENEYKKVSCYALALILLSLQENEFFSFSASPYDLGLNYRLGQTSLLGERYRMVFAPSCGNTAFLWDNESANDVSRISEDILSYLLGQKYTEDRPDDDWMLFVKTEDWNEFVSAHPDVTFRDEDVRDVSEKELAEY